MIPRTRVDIRGVMFDDVTLSEAASAAADAAAGAAPRLFAVYTPNSEIVQRCVEDTSGALYRVINSAGLIVPDSTGIVRAAALFGTPLVKVPGVELGEAVLALAAERGLTVCFLGGKPGVAEAAKARMEAKYSGLRVVGCRDGYFEKRGEGSDLVIEFLASVRPAVLYVCLGAPAQEVWIYENRDALAAAGVRAALALGGSLDIYAGSAKRAPKLFISLGLEWLYRLLREPSRIARMMALPRFWLGCKKEAGRRKKRK